jgi:hypothetical protein
MYLAIAKSVSFHKENTEMPIKIPISDCRKWLQEYEGGTSEAAIRKAAKRDINTIKDGIQRAREERRVNIVMTERLREALFKHQDQLLSIITQLHSSLIVPNLDSQPELRSKFEGASVVDSYEQPLKVIFNVESTPYWDLLHEHFKRDKIWKLTDEWKGKLLAHLEAKIALRSKVNCEVPKLQYPIHNKGETPDSNCYIYRQNTGDFIYRLILHRALKVTTGKSGIDHININPEIGKITSSDGNILARALGSEEDCKKRILGLATATELKSEIEHVIKTYSMLEEVTQKARSEAEEKQLLGMVPGRCRVCKKLGL